MVVLGVGEAAAVTTAGTVEVLEGPGDFKTTGKVETLVLTKVTAFQYMVSTAPGGEITHTAGPTSMFLTPAGTCPKSGSTIAVKDMFFAKSPTDYFGMYESSPDGSYTATAVNGPRMYMPPPTAYVAKYEMSSSTGEEEAMTFTYFSSAPQMMTLAIPGVVGPESTAGSLKLLLSIQIDPDKFVQCNSTDAIADLRNAAKTDYSTGASGYPTLKATGTAIGFTVGRAIELGFDPVEEGDTPLGKLEKLALEDKLKLEMSVQGAIAKQEIILAGAYARSQNAVVTVSQVVNANVKAMSQLAVMAKGSGGSDKNYSKVAACCCCSVATKTSGGAWASLEASGSSSLDINMLINSATTATSTTKIDEKFSYQGPYEHWEEFKYEPFRPL